MKSTRRILFLFSAALFYYVLPQCLAQEPPDLSIQTYAGVNITGTVDTVYTVQYTTSLNEPVDWRTAGIVQLPSSPYLWVDTAGLAAGQRFYRAVEGPTNLVWLAPGTFTMGSPSNEVQRYDWEGPQTVVTLTRGFFMGKFEVTQGEYAAVIGSNPSSFRNGSTGGSNGGSGNAVTNDLLHPVELVTWSAATNYCARLTDLERAAGWLPEGWEYRLPTEAEWEYACRGGTTSAFHYGSGLRSGVANFFGRAEYDSSLGVVNNPGGIFLGRTTIVGSYQGNLGGLYDMHGNVWEWCSDWWSETLPGGHVFDPQGAPTGPARVFRGGGWNDNGGNCRSGFRGYYYGDPSVGLSVVGFRVVLAPGP